MTLLWLAEARADIQRLFDFLAEKDLRAAGRMADCIIDGARVLENHPRAGKPMDDESGRRELFMPFGIGAYVLRYRLHEEHIVVIRVWHSRESRGP